MNNYNCKIEKVMASIFTTHTLKNIFTSNSCESKYIVCEFTRKRTWGHLHIRTHTHVHILTPVNARVWTYILVAALNYIYMYIYIYVYARARVHVSVYVRGSIDSSHARRLSCCSCIYSCSERKVQLCIDSQVQLHNEPTVQL